MIEIIDLKLNRQPQCRVQICQLSSSDFIWRSQNGLHYLEYNEKLFDKIISLLNVAKQNSVDLIVFPELSVPLKLVEKIQEWSKEHKAFVVAGSHYQNKEGKFISRSPIIINGEIFFTEKISPSPLEKSPIKGEGLSRGTTLKKFKNTWFGNIGILICSDYLDEDIKAALDLDDLDILCVPAFQKQSTVYESRMNIDCENSRNGIYILYSNFVDDKFGDGQSSLFGVMDKMFSQKFKEKSLTDLSPAHKLIQLNKTDEYFIVDLNINNKRPFVNRNVNTDSNVFFIDKSSWFNSASFDFVKKIANDDERYKRIDEYFVPPREYTEILDSLYQKNLVFIIGDPGIGKTYTAVKILKHYFDLGYDPIWFVGLEKEERDIQVKHLASFAPTDNQIVYFEDPFGRTVFERKDSLFQVFGPLVEKLSNLNSKIIITSRKEVFEKFSDESLLEKEILALKKELNVRNPSYDNTKLIGIFDRLASVYCEWYSKEEFRKAAYQAILSKKLSTPLSIRDFVFASRGVQTIEEIDLKIEKRENEMVKTFALEILGTQPSTKLFLYLVFLGGYKGHANLTDKFINTSSILKSKISGFIEYSFNIELRSQIGYRVEQLGKFKTVYRFSHPIYEESLAILVSSDRISELIVNTIILELAKDDVKEAFRTINKYVLKYPNLALIMFKHLFDQKHELKDDVLRIDLARKLISVYFITKEVSFFKLAESFYPLRELVNSINESSDIKRLADKLNLVQRYRRNSPLVFDSSYSNNIDFKRIFTVKLTGAVTSHKIINIFFESVAINHSVIPTFLDAFSPNLLKRAYFILNDGDRKRFLTFLPEIPLKNELLRIQHKIKNESPKGTSLKTNHEFRSLIFSDNFYDGEAYIDRGAESAIRKPWTNLLPVGITKVTGDFEASAIIAVKNKDEQIIGIGLSEYSSNDLKIIQGHSSTDFYELLGHYSGSSAIKAEFFLKSSYKNGYLSKWKART